MSVEIYRHRSYGHTFAVYYCSEEKVERYGGKDKVPLYVCGIKYEHQLDEFGCGVKHDCT